MITAPLWYWMRERQSIRDRRARGLDRSQWTRDPILQTYRFCNVFREDDRVTQWIRTHWREPYADHPNLWFALCAARQINWPPTLDAIGFPRLSDPQGMAVWMVNAKATLRERRDAGIKVYTGAYMLQGDIRLKPGELDKPGYTFDVVLDAVWNARQDFLVWMTGPKLSRPSASLQQVHSWLMRFRGWGGFLAYEAVTDLRHTRYLRAAPDVMTWAWAGPGAVRGLNRLAGRALSHNLAQERAVDEMRALLREAPRRLRGFPPLEMRDIEHSLCELDKYLRVKNGEGVPKAKYNPQQSYNW